MSKSHAPERIDQTEAAVLRALCQGSIGGAEREETLNRLRAYAWHNPEHQLIWEGLRTLRRGQPQFLREELPRMLTRKGFPDLELDSLFQPPCPDARDLAALLGELLCDDASTPRAKPSSR